MKKNIPSKVSKSKVVIYTLPTCPYCKQTKAFLEEHGVKYTNIDVSKNEKNYNQLLKVTGQESVPVIIANGEQHVGYNPKILERLFS